MPRGAWLGGTPISDLRRAAPRHAALNAAPLLLAFAATACVGGPRSTVGQAPPRLELIDLIELPAGTALDGVPLGGLSALAWDATAGLYHALSDDPGEHGPPRLYRLRLSFAGPSPIAEVLSWEPL